MLRRRGREGDEMDGEDAAAIAAPTPSLRLSPCIFLSKGHRGRFVLHLEFKMVPFFNRLKMVLDGD